MKRLISCLLILVLMAAAIPASAAAKVPVIEYDADVAVVGQTVSVDIWAKNFPKTISCSVVTSYDAAVLKPISFESKMPIDLFLDEYYDGKYTLVWMEGSGKTVEGDLLLGTLTFKVLAMPQTQMTSLSFADQQHNTLIDSKEKEVFTTSEGCHIPLYNNHTFTDVKNQWYKEAVLFASNNNLMNGMGDNKFKPDEATTRAMLVTILYRYEGEPDDFVKAPFTDLKQNWYKNPINWAHSKKIVQGMSEKIFAPDEKVTREQIAVMMYRYAKYDKKDVTQKKSLTSFSDAKKVSSWAKEAMEWAYAEGLITGNSINGKVLLDPQGNATRAQIATILMRYIKNAAEQ